MEPVFNVDPALRDEAKRIIGVIDNGEFDGSGFASMPLPSPSEAIAIRYYIERLLSDLCPEIRKNYKTHQFEENIKDAKETAQKLYVAAGF